MSTRVISYFASCLLMTAAPLSAQWLNYPTPGIPRTQDGKPNFKAAAPRAADGKPDLSGIWHGGPGNRKYFGDVAADLKLGEFPIQPWADMLTKQRRAGFQAKERPDTNCISFGLPQSYADGPYKIVQEPGLVVILDRWSTFRPDLFGWPSLTRRPKSDLDGVTRLASGKGIR